jgi:hypothetical protein
MPFGPWPGGGGGGGGGGLTNVNGTAGAFTTLRSPMASVSGAIVRIDHGNVKFLTDAATIVGIDVDLNTSFVVTLGGNRTVSNPTASIITTPRDGEEITFLFFNDNSITPRVVTWDTKYNFTFGNGGVRLYDFNVRMAAMLATEGLDCAVQIQFRYDAADDRWIAETCVFCEGDSLNPGTAGEPPTVPAMYADQLDVPDNADWAISAIAPTTTKGGTDDDLKVVQFDASTEQGRGFPLWIPEGATLVLLDYWLAAAAAPTAPNDKVQLFWRRKEYASNVAPTAWSTAFALAVQTMPANTRLQRFQETYLLSTLSLATGNLYNIEITRRTSGVTNPMPGNLLMALFRARVT